jgi:ubiquinone/menaquinone biosynthesis C-methylase UbiE
MVIEIKYDLKGSILDIGGGGEAVVGQIYGDRVTAIDNRQEELDEAPDCCTKLLMDAQKLLFSDNSFDNVTFFYTLMYMTEETQRKAICEAARVLKAGGMMCIWDCTIFSSTYPDPFVVDLDISSGGIIIHTSYGIVKRDTQSSDSIQQLLENAGLNIVSLKEADGQFIIQCRKE